jgi:hypothetical protein
MFVIIPQYRVMFCTSRWFYRIFAQSYVAFVTELCSVQIVIASNT